MKQEYAVYKNCVTKRDDFSFCNSFYLFYKTVFKSKQKVVELKHLKELVSRKFYPIMQHDSHEFMMYLLSSLQDEETPVEGSKFDGSDERKNLD